MEVGKRTRRRRTHTEEFKQSVVAACGEAGASVAGVALANGLNANQVRRWMRERGVEPPNHRLTVPSVLSAGGAPPAFIPVQIPSGASCTSDIRVEVRRGSTVVKLHWPAQAASECAGWLRDWLR